MLATNYYANKRVTSTRAAKSLHEKKSRESLFMTILDGLGSRVAISL